MTLEFGNCRVMDLEKSCTRCNVQLTPWEARSTMCKDCDDYVTFLMMKYAEEMERGIQYEHEHDRELRESEMRMRYEDGNYYEQMER